MKDHTIYLKALTKSDKNKTIESEAFRRDLESLTKEYPPHSKSINIIDDDKAGRKFILENLEEFLNYSLEFSLADKMHDLWSEVSSK
jgi:hypothetical protein